ncbi:MAG: DNA repair protein RecN [Anaerolineales bacterium]|nr:DNA repair protein RecN [Anaerolineales bacterium]
MLVELRITNFAIIDEVYLEFSEGFNVMTGETGAGKSIVIDAVNVVLGATADRDFIRTGSDKATVEAVFRIPQALQADIQHMLDEESVDYQTLDELLFSREIRTNGRSVARINGSVCKLNTYREIGSLLLDIHGQSEHLTLLRPREHIYLLDRFAGLEPQRHDLAKLVRELQHVRRTMSDLLQDEAALARRAEILTYQVEEIDASKLKLGEDEALKAESDRLANSEKLMTLSLDAERLLFADEVGETGAVELLEEASVVLSRLALLDPSMQELATLAETVSIQAGELADGVRRYSERIDVSPQQLDYIEERLTLIATLKRKYGGSIQAILDYAEKARAELENITHSEEHLAELRQQEEGLLRRIGVVAGDLSQKRKHAGDQLAQLIERELKDLRMDAAQFAVAIQQEELEDGCFVNNQRLAFDHTGIDHVEFMIAANFGEPLKPLAKVASGGETARSMLALKNVLSKADHTPTLIFDEIDQGIGGRLGTVLGEKLWRLSTQHQVLCITHLAQLACFGDAHFRVSKGVVGKRTITEVHTLNDAGRQAELSQMLGAETDSARQNAHDLLELARQIKVSHRVNL